jgi:hypothetical protein
MTSQSGRVSRFAGAPAVLRRLSVALVALGGCLALAQCAWLGSPAGPTAPTSSAPAHQARTLTNANLIKAADLSPAIGGAKVVEDGRNARGLDQLSVCQQQPLTALGPTAIKSRSFQARYRSGGRPFPRSTLDHEPDRYAVALQFPDPGAAQRAKFAYEGWIAGCADSVDLPKGIHGMRSNLDWTPVDAGPAEAEVSEVAYKRGGSSGNNHYFESVGLTLLEDRMMITVHIFYNDESPYSVGLGEEEAGFAHPQLALIEAAARRLAE